MYIGYNILIGIPIILGVHAALASQACDSLNTPKDVLECALDFHPDLVRGKGSLKQADSLGDQAAQRPNPELSARSLVGKNEGESITGHEINLAHTFELGGKRSARIDKANAEKDQIFLSLNFFYLVHFVFYIYLKIFSLLL